MNEPPPAPPRPPHTATHGRRLVREPDDRKIAGVCSGLADNLGVDVTVLRVAAVMLGLLTPVALIGYLVASVAVPERAPDEPRVRSSRVHLGQIPHPVIVIGALVAVAAFIDDDAWWLNPFPAAVALVGMGVWLIVQGREDADPDPLSARPWPTPPADGPPVEGPPVDRPPVDGPPVDDPPVDAGGVPPDRGDQAVAHPMAASPWVVASGRGADAEGDAGTTLWSDPVSDDVVGHLQPPEGAGSSGEPPPPASPWWSGSPAGASAGPPVATHPTRPSRLGTVFVALILAAAGALWLVDSLDVARIAWTSVFGLGLVVAGVGLIVASWWGRAYALMPAAFLLAGSLTASEVLDAPFDAGVGERVEIVDTVGELREHHELFAGELLVDLTDAPLPATGTTRVEASIGMGELRVVVPEDATVDVRAKVRAGEVVSPGGADANESGIGLDETFTLAGERGGPRLVLDLSAGFGSVEVTRG